MLSRSGIGAAYLSLASVGGQEEAIRHATISRPFNMHTLISCTRPYMPVRPGPLSIFDALTNLYADRGHGYKLFTTENLREDGPLNPIVQQLLNVVPTVNAVKVCLSSIFRPIPALRYQAAQLKDSRTKLSIVLCTDNRLISNTTVTDDIGLPAQLRHLLKRHRDMVTYGWRSLSGKYSEKAPMCGCSYR